MQSATPGAPTSVHLPVRQDWLDQRRETIIEPELPIVDPHHHLVDRPETGRYCPVNGLVKRSFASERLVMLADRLTSVRRAALSLL